MLLAVDVLDHVVEPEERQMFLAGLIGGGLALLASGAAFIRASRSARVTNAVVGAVYLIFAALLGSLSDQVWVQFPIFVVPVVLVINIIHSHQQRNAIGRRKP
jgi:hypothetical protein